MLFYIRHGAVPEASIPETPVAENLFEQSVATPEITFTYPKAFGLAVKEDQVMTTSYIPPCNAGFDYCLYYNGTSYGGTNFDSAGLRIERRLDLSEREVCLTTPPEGFENNAPVTLNSGEYATSLFPEIGDAGAGHYAQGKLYRLSYKDACYEFETRISASQYANYEPGTLVEFTETNRALLQADLEAIVQSITFTDSKESVAFPR